MSRRKTHRRYSGEDRDNVDNRTFTSDNRRDRNRYENRDFNETSGGKGRDETLADIDESEAVDDIRTGDEGDDVTDLKGGDFDRYEDREEEEEEDNEESDSFRDYRFLTEE
nr:hypothetical protein BaRGS_004597 [Batillaria attramentaria]